MTEIIKDSFYKSRYYEFSINEWDLSGKDGIERKKLKELSKQPIPQDIINESLRNLGKSAAGQHYAYLGFYAIGKELNSIAGIDNFKHLQHVDISRNNIITLKPLSHLKYMTYLNCSHNKLTKLLDMKEIPHNLEQVDSSYNQIEVISDLSAHRFLKKLNLDNNKIARIEGTLKNSNLQVLKLANNKIEEIENLQNLNLTHLDLMGNQIKVVLNLDKLPKLRSLNLSCNQIVKLKGLVDLVSLRELYLSNNCIGRVRELFYVEQLPFLSVLDLCYNKIQSRRYYRFQVLYRLPGLRVLDGISTVAEEFIKAENLYGVDLEERRKNFKDVLPDEEFIDRRINIAELIEPESQDENEQELEYQDTYDREGVLIRTTSLMASKKSTNSLQQFSTNSRRTQDGFLSPKLEKHLSHTHKGYKSQSNISAKSMEKISQKSYRSEKNQVKAKSNIESNFNATPKQY